MPTLIQISDLHRSQSEPIDNDTLLASVVADLDRFSAANEAPEALIVSGDLIQGARVGDQGFEREMRNQYRVAFDFIARICEEIFGGDRSKVAIVPGNHDVCWNTSKSSMELVAPESYPTDLRKELLGRDSPFRWSWDEQKLYRITRNDLYNSRTDQFWDGLKVFYDGVTLPLPIDRHRGFNLFSFFRGRALVAGFESTHRNDHLRYEAELEAGAPSRFALHMRRERLNPELLLAVWHHSVHGAPSKEDYLNIEAIKEMAALGFQVGFHGHQHLAESSDLSVTVGGSASMCLISAGSLCASWQDLPRGINRQYNIVSFDDRLEAGTLHIREMVDGSQFSARTNGRFLGGAAPLTWSPRQNSKNGSVSSDSKTLRDLTISVEEANRNGISTPATLALLRLRPAQGTYPRSVLLHALRADACWSSILEQFVPPVTADEAIVVAEAAYRSGDLESLTRVLSSDLLPTSLRDDFVARRDYLKLRGAKT